MMKFIKVLYHSIRVGIGYILFNLTNKNYDFAYQSFVRFFCLTRGKGIESFNSLIKLTPPKIVNNERSELFPNINQDQIYSIVSQLNKNGYCVLESKVPQEIIEEFERIVSTVKCYPRTTNKADNLSKPIFFDLSMVDNPRYDYREEDYLNSELIQKLIADPLFFNIAAQYFGSRPYLDLAPLWWQTSAGNADGNAAQMYHFDLDRPKWIKVFVYLTDVDLESGAHTFIKGSHLPGAIPDKLLINGYQRLDDHTVESYYSPDRVIKFAAPKGTIIIEDTKGLHKGDKATDGARLTFNIQYSNSLFGASHSSNRLKIDTISSFLKEQMERHKESFQLIK